MKALKLSQPLQTLLLLLLTTSPCRVLAITNDFSSYPSGSQACLTSSADSSGCTGDTGTEMNTCLCGNGGNFIYNTASCVAKNSPSDLTTVYATLQNNCAGTGVTISVSEAAFLAQASAATSTTTPTATATTSGTTSTGTDTTTTGTTTGTATGTTTSSSTSSPTSTASSDSGLSTGAKIGIGAGIGLASAGLMLAGAFVWVYNRRRRPKTGGAYTQTASPPGEYSSTFGQPREYAGTYTGTYASTYASTYGHPSPNPSTAIPLSATSGWQSPAVSDIYYKPQDVQQPVGIVGLGQPLLAELGGDGYVNQGGPVELYAPHQPESLTPGTQQQGQHGFNAELPANEDPTRLQSPPSTHSPYSPPYERSHF